MHIKPIKTKTDYNNALIHIGKLMAAKPNSPQADELEVLTVLVEDYERKHYPRELTIKMIKALHNTLGIPVEVLIGN